MTCSSQVPAVILDNGASSIKASVQFGEIRNEARIITNAVVRSKGDKKTYFGHEIEQCRDFSSLHYRLPFEKGYLTDWDAQKAVWDGVFSSEVLGVDTSEASLLITEPPFNLPNIQDVYDQFVFEEYDFPSYLRCTPASLIPHGNLFTAPGSPVPECMLVVDSGFSFTHVVPIINGSVAWKSVKRLDVGGKLLTNQLKELVSFRQWNMMDETYIVNEVKEQCCYISNTHNSDMRICHSDPRRNDIVLEYILPDFSTNRSGRVKTGADMLSDSDQVLYMSNERFSVPEILFRPSDVGLDQSGIAETIAISISTLPHDLQGLFWANIGLIGGNVKFPGFRERLMQELRCLAPVEYDVRVYESSDPITESHNAGVELVKSADFAHQVVTRAEYLESGSNACRRKFRDWRTISEGQAEEDKAGRRERPVVRGKGKTRAQEGVADAPQKGGRTRTKSPTKRAPMK